MVIELLIKNDVFATIETNSPELELKTYKDMFPEITSWRELVIPSTSMRELKAKKIESFKILRDREEVSPIEYNGKLFDYDDKARERLRVAKDALVDNNLPSQEWTCYDNTKMKLTIQDFKNINTIAAVRSANLHKKYNEMKDKITACKTVEELDKIEWL